MLRISIWPFILLYIYYIFANLVFSLANAEDGELAPGKQQKFD